MLLDLILQDTVLTSAIVIVAAAWGYALYRNVRNSTKSQRDFQLEYNRVLNAKEYKVKGRFEE